MVVDVGEVNGPHYMEWRRSDVTLDWGLQPEPLQEAISLRVRKG